MKVHETNLGVIEDGHAIEDEVFLVDEVSERTTGAGKPYYDLGIRNGLGKGFVKVWTITEELKPKDFVRVTMAGVTHPKYGRQWKLNYYAKIDHEGDDQFFAHIREVDVDGLFNEMVGFDYKNVSIGRIRDAFVADTDLVELFKLVPASASNHHAFKGGLIQHTYEVWDLCRKAAYCQWVSDQHKSFNIDIMLFGALIHDISKCYEYKFDEETENTVSLPLNGLVNNTVAGVLVLENLIRRAPSPIDRNIVLMLQHIIVSHQTRREWASPVPPMFPEAIIVAAMDNLSSNLIHYEDALEKDRSPDNPYFTSPYFFYNPNGGSQRVFKKPEIDNDFGSS